MLGMSNKKREQTDGQSPLPPPPPFLLFLFLPWAMVVVRDLSPARREAEKKVMLGFSIPPYAKEDGSTAMLYVPHT